VPVEPRADAAVEGRPGDHQATAVPAAAVPARPVTVPAPEAAPSAAEPIARVVASSMPPARDAASAQPTAGQPASFQPAPFQPAPFQPAPLPQDGESLRPTCTVAQLRRFIKSRPWIPLHELRRRFGIYGTDDDVSPIHVGGHTLFVGLPPAEARLMAELLDGGDVGYELSLDPGAPIVVGVYPMRPVPRG
jgi:hypothetical protein